MVVAINGERDRSVSTLVEALSLHAGTRPNSTAVTEIQSLSEPATTTFATLASKAQQFSDRFNREIPSDTNVLFLLSRSANCVAAIFGALKSGHTFACLSDKLRLPQIASVLAESNPACVIIDSAGLMALRSMVDAGSELDSVKWFLIRDARYRTAHERVRKKLTQLIDIEEWDIEEWDTEESDLADTVPSAVRSITPHSDSSSHPACILFTSGSTGRQRGVLISRANLEACSQAEAELYGLSSDDSLLGVLPFAFDVGLMQLLSGIRAGAAVTLLDSWLPQDVLNTCEQQSITGISAVPSIWAEFLAGERTFATDNEHQALRYITISGGDLSPEQLARIDSIAPGVGIFKTYGQSETFRSSAMRPEEFSQRPKSVGRAFGEARVYVVREDGSRANTREVGEIVHAGPGTMLGYVGGSDDRKLQPNPFQSESDTAHYAVFTGDLGWIDESGYLFLQGRRDDLIKINGNRVHLAEVRNELCRLDEVRSAEIVTLSDDGSNRLVAFVVTQQGSKIDAQQLRNRFMSTVPSYMVPEHVFVRRRIPKTANGKPHRQTLIAEARTLLDEQLLMSSTQNVERIDG